MRYSAGPSSGSVTRAGGIAPPADDDADAPSDLDFDAATGEFAVPSFEAAEEPVPPPVMQPQSVVRSAEAAPMQKTMFSLGSAAPSQPAPSAPAAPEPAPDKTARRRATTLTGVAAPQTKDLAQSIGSASIEPAAPPSSLAAPHAARKTQGPAPYKAPPRFALWLIIALVMAIIAALVWWLAS